MANNIDGPLYYERMGRTGPVMAFVHPNPMDQSCWIFQMAHLSTWYRCIAIDIPGYGRSPKADAELTMTDMAEACWEAIDDALPAEKAILVGCSVGSSLAPHTGAAIAPSPGCAATVSLLPFVSRIASVPIFTNSRAAARPSSRSPRVAPRRSMM